MRYKLLKNAIFMIMIALLIVMSSSHGPLTEDCQHGMYKKLERTSSIPPTVKVDLNQSPKTRWNHIVSHKKKEIQAAIGQVVKLISDISPKIVNLVDNYLPKIITKLPSPYDEELEGISAATEVPYGEILLFNIFYEVFTACTSIVATDKEGVVYHARNLDFGLFMGWDSKNKTWMLTEYLRPLVINVEFVKDNQTLFKSVNFAGYVGVLTGVKQKAFTLTLNERFNVNGGYIGILEWILGIRSGSWTTFLTRDVLEKAESYDQAVEMLSHKEILAPVYYIVGGRRAYEGAIITRDRTSMADLLPINGTKAGWYVLQTNYDNWKNPPFFDDRRTPGMKCMNEAGHANIGFPALYDVLSTKPNLNLLTTYTTLMQVDMGVMETYDRVCPNPCFPW